MPAFAPVSSFKNARSDMCGILCVCNIAAGAESYRSKVLDRARRMRHRGPDW
jgi:glutamate synthase domain-containing protein 1